MFVIAHVRSCSFMIVHFRPFHGRTWKNMDEHGRTLSEGVGDRCDEHGGDTFDRRGGLWKNIDEHCKTFGPLGSFREYFELNSF